MLIDSFYPGVEIHREDKIIYAKLLHPHTVISTCRAAGGIQTKLACIYNHQGSEPAGHSHRHNLKIWRDPTAWRRITCQRYDLPDEKCATLGTAANMNNAAFVRESFRDLVVGVVCTGGGGGGMPAVPEIRHRWWRPPTVLRPWPPAESSPGPGHHQYHDIYQQALNSGCIDTGDHDRHRSQKRSTPGTGRQFPVFRRFGNGNRHRSDCRCRHGNQGPGT